MRTTHFHLVTRFRKSGADPSLPHSPSWRAQAQHYLHFFLPYMYMFYPFQSVPLTTVRRGDRYNTINFRLCYFSFLVISSLSENVLLSNLFSKFVNDRPNISTEYFHFKEFWLRDPPSNPLPGQVAVQDICAEMS